jgi:serine carboxypeptidase S28
VIVLLGGETSGEDRLPFMKYGILQKLIKELHGVGVVLEHRYYGDSFPTDDLSVDSLRFLDTQQALADVAYFAQHVKFKGLEDYALTSQFTAWFAYGSSYAGSMAVRATRILSNPSAELTFQ